MKDTNVYIATHKLFVPPSNSIYQPIVAGADYHYLPYLKDNTGDNISYKNPFYSELTVLYWMWKHNKSEFVGLTHFHRYFKKTFHYLSKEEIKNILETYDVIVPYPLNFPCTVLEQYESVHYKKDLLLSCEKLEDKDFRYSNSIQHVLNGCSMYSCNMFVSSNSFLNDYAAFLFPFLFELEQEIPYLNYSIYNQRVFGFLAERIFNIYLHKNQFKVFEYPTVDTYSLKRQQKASEKILSIIHNESIK